MDLFFREYGEDGKPVMVLLHGLLGSSRNWQMIGRDLAATHKVYALDLRNHGSSPHAAEMSYPVMAADVLAWLDARGLRRVTLMGHSMGGKTAMLLACTHPERFERLIVVDIAPKDYLSFAHRAEFAAMNELHLPSLATRSEAELRLEARVPDWPMRKFLVTNLEPVEGGGWRWMVNLPVLTQALPELERDPLAETARYEGPTLFITGGKSRYVQPTDWAKIVQHFPKADIEIIAESGHNPHMDARERFMALLKG